MGMRSIAKRVLRKLVPKPVPPPEGERRKAFIISAPRSGSTWLKRALNEHPKIYCTENRLFGRYCDVVPNADETETLRVTMDEYAHVLSGYYDYRALGMDLLDFKEEMVQHLANAMFEFAYLRSGKPVVVDKITPYRNTSDLVLSQINRFSPGARRVQLVRDGRDVATSGVFDWIARTKRDHPRYAAFVKKETSVSLDRFFDDEDIAQWADEWAEPIRAFKKSGGAPLTIRFEDMKQDQAAVLGKVFDFLGVAAAPETIQRCIKESSFKKMSAGRKAGEGVATAKVRKGIAGDWVNYFTQRDGTLFHELAGDCLIEMGYVEDGSWAEVLPEKLPPTEEGDV